jgi:hypothetical protein
MKAQARLKYFVNEQGYFREMEAGEIVEMARVIYTVENFLDP